MISKVIVRTKIYTYELMTHTNNFQIITETIIHWNSFHLINHNLLKTSQIKVGSVSFGFQCQEISKSYILFNEMAWTPEAMSSLPLKNKMKQKAFHVYQSQLH